eukprot:scaffold104716_cov54-Attheya_sp.AAC.3
MMRERMMGNQYAVGGPGNTTENRNRNGRPRTSGGNDCGDMIKGHTLSVKYSLEEIEADFYKFNCEERFGKWKEFQKAAPGT